MTQKFDKKIFTAKIFIKDTGFLISKTPQIINATRNEKISKAFIEKIMAVVTAVNGCTYCTWYHAKQAVESGISADEVKNMLNLQFQADASDFELTALLYAQHYAETNRNPDEEMTAKLFDYYGDETANHIIIFIRMIFFGNLLGNTWDAVLSRLKGNPAENSSVIFEFFFFLLTFIVMIPAMFLSKEHRSKDSD
jgi:AhpD family alkylhydroperoxidase